MVSFGTPVPETIILAVLTTLVGFSVAVSVISLE